MSAAGSAGKIGLHTSMSVDGFITGPDDGQDHAPGVGRERLHAWLRDDRIDPGSHRRGGGGTDDEVFHEMMASGAVIAGRRTFDLARGLAGDHHDGDPVFVLTRSVPDEPAPRHAPYVTGVESAFAQSRQAAGGRDVMMHGAAAARACPRAGLRDKLKLHLVPVLLGQGRGLFDGLSPDHGELELLRSLKGSDVLHLRYRIHTDARAGG